MEKFHYFLYGKEFTLETDQKPLVSIYKKHMVDISPRVQRLIVRSFPYQPFNVIYKKGKDIPVADALSRVTPMDPEDQHKITNYSCKSNHCAHPVQCTSSRYLFQKVRLTQEEYSAGQSTHKTQPLHQHRLSL